jgi:AhpD family alkylhydroperoxidase
MTATTTGPTSGTLPAARMAHPAAVLPGAMDALLALGRAVEAGPVPHRTHKLLQLRASQINGCGLCVDLHARELRAADVPEEVVWAVGAWRESPHFTDPERAALALAESVTRLADRAEAVPDEVWDAAADVFDETELAALLVSIASINLWNRLNAATRQPAGQRW